MNSQDTIAAIGSPPAPCARIIVRLSGPQSHPIAHGLLDCAQTPVSEVLRGAGADAGQPGSLEYVRAGVGEQFPPFSAQLATLHFNHLLFPAWIYAFQSPRSYTGEDAIEFHLPGSPVLAKLLLDELYRQGARPAEPGEFTARAFFNGKLSLTQAEGVAATIAAGNEAALAAERQLLAGELARRLAPIAESLAQTLALIEVGIDFSEEDVTFLASDEVAERIQDADESLADLLDQSNRFEQLTHEPKIVFAGRPNAGKSSLINALAGHARAVVSSVAGTTRDVLTATVDLPHGRVQLTDIAGLEADATGEIDRQMQRRAADAIASADYLICVQDCMDSAGQIELPRKPDFMILTKTDLFPDVHPGLRESGAIRVSSKTGEGLDSLRHALDHLVFGGNTAAALALNRRHLLAIQSAREALSRAATRTAENAPELVAMDLRDVLDSLGGVVGQVTPDDILGKVFSAFCIGK